VLGLIEGGASPYDAVTGLAHHALHITDGLLPDPAALREQLEDLEDTLADYPGDDTPDLADVELRLTPLDPKQPARDLLEDLLSGIYGCWLLHSEYDDLDDEDDVAGDTEDHGTWTFAVDSHTALDGKRHTVRRGGFPKKKAAKKALHRFLEGERTGFSCDPDQSVADYLDEWFHAKEAFLKPTTIARYRTYIYDDLVPAFRTV
jgi:hypothetical protein